MESKKSAKSFFGKLLNRQKNNLLREWMCKTAARPRRVGIWVEDTLAYHNLLIVCLSLSVDQKSPSQGLDSDQKYQFSLLFIILKR